MTNPSQQRFAALPEFCQMPLERGHVREQSLLKQRLGILVQREVQCVLLFDQSIVCTERIPHGADLVLAAVPSLRGCHILRNILQPDPQTALIELALQ